jgi:thiol:disulfide interchange protein
LNTYRFLAVLGCLALLCTISSAQEAKLEQEGARAFIVVGPDQWVDLLVKVDPKGAEIDAGSLQAVGKGEKGVAFDRPIFPPADKGASYTKPFAVRIPVRLPGSGSHEVEVALTGKKADGSALALTATTEVSATETRRHVTATASLKEPAVAGKPNAVVIQGDVIDGYHVYGAQVEIGLPITANLLPAPGARGAALWKSAGDAKPDGDELHHFSFEVPFTPLQAGKVELRVLLNWQACTPMTCDPNEIAYVPFSFDVEPGGTGSGEAPGSVIAKPPPGQRAEPGAADGTGPAGGKGDLEGKGLLELILLAVGGGLFALAMPCTYPLIPITISFFTKQAEQRHGKVTGLALAYGAGIVGIFTVVGVVFGEPVIAFATLWWVNALFALLFLVFGLSLIGLFDIRLPGFFNDIAAKASGTGGYLSVFAMGATLVITSFTCTAPIIGLVLVWAAQGGSLFKVGFTMAIFGLTMAIPFVFLSLSPTALQKMPRSGEWMQTIKVTLGIVELGLVLKFLSNIDLAIGTYLIDRELFLGLWGLSFLAAALYLLGVFQLGAKWSVGKGRAAAGVALLAVTAYLGSGLGGDRLGKNLEAFLPILPERELEYTDGFLAVVKEDYEKGVAKATELGAPIFLDFTGFL